MAKDPAFLFYSSDFLTGVYDLTMEERGQYITLLCLQHQKGHLPEKTVRLCLGYDSVLSSSAVIAKFELDSDGLFFNKRLDSEIERREHFVNSCKANGAKGGRPKKDGNITDGLPMGYPMGKPIGKPKHNPSENENDNENEDVIDTDNNEDTVKKTTLDSTRFETFWKAYPKKTGKAAALRSWKKIKVNEGLYQKILSAIEQAKQTDQWAKEHGQFIPFPATWLNQGRWDDEYGGTQEPAQKLSGKYGTYL